MHVFTATNKCLALTCSEKTQFKQRATITTASSTVATLRTSPTDSTREMLPTCQS